MQSIQLLFTSIVLVSVSGLTVSGISSGAYFAGQFQVAYSSSVSGAGIIAGGPYYCSQNSVTLATTACMNNPELINIDKLVQSALKFSETGLIDSTLNLNTSKIWMFSGKLDTVVLQGVVKANYQFFSNFVKIVNIITNFDVLAEHSWVTNLFGNLCGYLGSPYLNNCEIDAAGEFLTMFYGQLKPKGTENWNHLHLFLQSKYGDVVFSGMLSYGYVYVPAACEKSKCEVHVAFHGCLQSAELVADVFVKHNGLNSWAESNNIVVIYPQILSTLNNPQGCWDFWGYTGSDFAYKSGKQMKMVYLMTQNVPYVSW